VYVDLHSRNGEIKLLDQVLAHHTCVHFKKNAEHPIDETIDVKIWIKITVRNVKVNYQ
jgi:hypothetical protein